MKKLEGKVAVITGGNSGIGQSIAKKYADEGADIVIFGRNQKTIDETVRLIGNGVHSVQGDVTRLEDLGRLFDSVKEKYGKIDILVVNAGIAQVSPLDQTTEAFFDRTSDINFKGAFFTVQKALPLLSEGASIILVSSVVNIKGFPGFSVYSASKAALRSLGRSFAAELAPKGIRVNTLSPGPIETPIFSKMGLPEDALEGMAQNFAQQVPLGRMGQPDEMAAVALFLASEDSTFVNGVDLAADGGLAQV